MNFVPYMPSNPTQETFEQLDDLRSKEDLTNKIIIGKLLLSLLEKGGIGEFRRCLGIL